MGADCAFVPVIGVQAKWWQHPAACAPGCTVQPDVLLDPCGNGHAQPHSPQCSLLDLCAKCCLSPCCLLQGMGVMQWCSGLQVLPSWGFLGNSARSPPRKILERSGFGEMPGPFLPLLPISCCPGSKHTLDNQVGSHSPRSGELTVFQHCVKALNAGKPEHEHHVKIKGELKTSRP